MAATPEMAALIAADDALLNRSVSPMSWAHEAPDHPLSTDDAHGAMQRHAGCAVDNCARKRVAQKVLVEAGHVVPDPRNSRNLG